MSNSALVVNAHFLMEPVAKMTAAASESNVKYLPISARIDAMRVNKKTISYKMLVVVMLIHMLALVGVLSVQPETVELNHPETPMMVSLVSQVADVPQELPKPPVEQVQPVNKPPVLKPVVQKQKVIEKKLVVNEEAVRKVEQVEPAVVEERKEAVVAESTPAEPQQSAKVAEVSDKVANKQVATEPVIEPPSFGAAYLNNPAPAYPMLARKMGEQGKVLLKVLVSQDGKAEVVKVDTSSGHQKLDQAAIEAVKRWSFVPAKRSNQPISAYVLVPVNFTLNG
ncbi:MAG: energy transducer TonB [Methylotenera sp.]|nr:energy transducer TonB [Methylotenera sp.]MDO9389444.1 energy transducer TonB [Methylotenera sp.]